MSTTISIHNFQAIYFDAGDTLLTLPGAHERMHHYLAGQSFHRSPERIATEISEAFRTLYYGKEVRGDETCSPESDAAFWANLYRHILVQLGAQEEHEEQLIHRWSHELYAFFTSPEQYELFDDVVESLERFKRDGFQLGVISNFAPSLPAILREKRIDGYFDHVLVSTLVGLEKPNPAIFQLALEQAKLLPQQMLYVGDHDQNDIWAPNQAGIAAVKIKRYAHMTGEGICSLRELV